MKLIQLESSVLCKYALRFSSLSFKRNFYDKIDINNYYLRY